MCLFFYSFFWCLMKRLLFFIFVFFSFNSFAVVTVSSGSSSCTMSPNYHQDQVGLTFLNVTAAKDYLSNLDGLYSGTKCSGYTFSYLEHAANGASNGTYTYRFGSKIKQLTYGGAAGCTYSQCQTIAENECSSVGQTLDTYQFDSSGTGNFTKTCKDLPPLDEPINSQECTDLAHNQCFSHDGFSGTLTFDDGAISGNNSCNYTCNDGTTGDKFGSNANEPNGICDPNDPNDLVDCDVVDTSDPDCFIGCGDAYIPEPTNTITYNADGNNNSSGTGTDNITNVQGDVLINEIIKLKNENAEQIIMGSNAVITSVLSLDPTAKLDEVIMAIENSGSSGSTYDDSNLISAVNSASTSDSTNASALISAIESNSLSAIPAGNGTTYGSGNFTTFFLDTTSLDSQILNSRTTLDNQIDSFKASMLTKFQVSVTGSGYQSNNLDLSQGTYDISWSRFSQYFGSIGTILYALASLVAMTILFQGRM